MQSKPSRLLPHPYGGTFKKDTLTSADIIQAVSEKIRDIRQLVSYVSVVPDKTPPGKECLEVKFSASDKSDQLLQEIVQDVTKKYDLKDARLFHAIGDIKIDDDLILAVAVGKDRKSTFKAIQEMIIAAKNQAEIRTIYVLSDGSTINL